MGSFPPPDKKKRTEISKRANARRDPAERNPHFSLTIEVKKDQQSCLEAIKQRINRKTSATQNADLGAVHTNPFSNGNLAVLLRFQKDLRPYLSFSHRFRPSILQRRICLKTLLYPQCAWSNELDACPFIYIGRRNWREIEATW